MISTENYDRIVETLQDEMHRQDPDLEDIIHLHEEMLQETTQLLEPPGITEQSYNDLLAHALDYICKLRAWFPELQTDKLFTQNTQRFTQTYLNESEQCDLDNCIVCEGFPEPLTIEEA